MPFQKDDCACPSAPAVTRVQPGFDFELPTKRAWRADIDRQLRALGQPSFAQGSGGSNPLGHGPQQGGKGGRPPLGSGEREPIGFFQWMARTFPNGMFGHDYQLVPQGSDNPEPVEATPCSEVLKCTPGIEILEEELRDPAATSGYRGQSYKGGNVWWQAPEELRSVWGDRVSFDASGSRWAYIRISTEHLYSSSITDEWPTDDWRCQVPWLPGLPEIRPEYANTAHITSDEVFNPADAVFVVFQTIPYVCTDWTTTPWNGGHLGRFKFWLGQMNNVLVLPVGGEDWPRVMDWSLLNEASFSALLAMMALRQINQAVWSMPRCYPIQSLSHSCDNIYIGPNTLSADQSRNQWFTDSLSKRFGRGAARSYYAPHIGTYQNSTREPYEPPSEYARTNLVLPRNAGMADGLDIDDSASRETVGKTGNWGHGSLLGSMAGTIQNNWPPLPDWMDNYEVTEGALIAQAIYNGEYVSSEDDDPVRFSLQRDDQFFPTHWSNHLVNYEYGLWEDVPTNSELFAAAKRIFEFFYANQILFEQSIGYHAPSSTNPNRDIEATLVIRDCLTSRDLETPDQLYQRIAGMTRGNSLIMKNALHDLMVIDRDKFGGSSGY